MDRAERKQYSFAVSFMHLVDQNSEPGTSKELKAQRFTILLTPDSSSSVFVCFWCDGVDRPGAHGVNSLSG